MTRPNEARPLFSCPGCERPYAWCSQQAHGRVGTLGPDGFGHCGSSRWGRARQVICRPVMHHVSTHAHIPEQMPHPGQHDVRTLSSLQPRDVVPVMTQLLLLLRKGNGAQVEQGQPTACGSSAASAGAQIMHRCSPCCPARFAQPATLNANHGVSMLSGHAGSNGERSRTMRASTTASTPPPCASTRSSPR